MQDETLLLQEIAAGNEKAFRQLFEAYYSKLYKYLLQVTKSREITEEIIIDIFLKLWLGRDLITHIQHLDGFLHKVAYNKALDFFRMTARNTRLQKMVQKKLESVQEQEADHQLLDREYQHVLEKAINQLSPQRKLVFTLSRMEGKTYDEIAKQLNLSRNTVRNTMAGSLHAIRRFLQHHGFNGITLLLYLMNC